MSTYNGDNYAKAIDPSAANILGPGIWGGRVRVQHDSYTINAKASGTVLRMGKLPAGARVLAVLLNNDALGSAVTLAVGNEGSGQGAIFSAAASAASASDNPRVCMLSGAVAYTVGTLSGDDVITVTTGGATTASADRVISVDTLYVVD